MEIKTKFDIGEEVYSASLCLGIKKVRIKNIFSTYDLEEVEIDEKEKKDFFWALDEKDNCLFRTKEEAEKKLKELKIKGE